MGRYVDNVRDLEVYKAAFQLQQRIFEMTKGWPSEERYSLIDAELQETCHWLSSAKACDYYRRRRVGRERP